MVHICATELFSLEGMARTGAIVTIIKHRERRMQLMP